MVSWWSWLEAQTQAWFSCHLCEGLPEDQWGVGTMSLACSAGVGGWRAAPGRDRPSPGSIAHSHPARPFGPLPSSPLPDDAQALPAGLTPLATHRVLGPAGGRSPSIPDVSAPSLGRQSRSSGPFRSLGSLLVRWGVGALDMARRRGRGRGPWSSAAAPRPGCAEGPDAPAHAWVGRPRNEPCRGLSGLRGAGCSPLGAPG